MGASGGMGRFSFRLNIALVVIIAQQQQAAPLNSMIVVVVVVDRTVGQIAARQTGTGQSIVARQYVNDERFKGRGEIENLHRVMVLENALGNVDALQGLFAQHQDGIVGVVLFLSQKEGLVEIGCFLVTQYPNLFEVIE